MVSLASGELDLMISIVHQSSRDELARGVELVLTRHGLSAQRNAESVEGATIILIDGNDFSRDGQQNFAFDRLAEMRSGAQPFRGPAVILSYFSSDRLRNCHLARLLCAPSTYFLRVPCRIDDLIAVENLNQAITDDDLIYCRRIILESYKASFANLRHRLISIMAAPKSFVDRIEKLMRGSYGDDLQVGRALARLEKSLEYPSAAIDRFFDEVHALVSKVGELDPQGPSLRQPDRKDLKEAIANLETFRQTCSLANRHELRRRIAVFKDQTKRWKAFLADSSHAMNS